MPRITSELLLTRVAEHGRWRQKIASQPAPVGVTLRWQRCPRCTERHVEISDVMFCPHAAKGAGMVRISGQWGRSGRVLEPLLDTLRRSIGIYYSRSQLIEIGYGMGEFEPDNADNCMGVFMCNLNSRLRGSRLELVRPGGGFRQGYKLEWRARGHETAVA